MTSVADQLVLDLLRAPKSVLSSRIAALNAADWDRLLDQGVEHRFLPAVAWVLEECCDQPASVPISVRDRLAATRHVAALHALASTAQCVRIHRVLLSAGIPHVFLKGAALAHVAYPHPGMRPMRDLDILVPEGDLDAALAVLAPAGATASNGTLLPGRHHLDPFQMQGGVLQVELHGRLAPAGRGFDEEGLSALEQAIWQGVRPLRVAGADLPVPSAEAMLVHLVLHGVQQHQLNVGPLLAADLSWLMRRDPPDPFRAAALSERVRAGRAFEVAAWLLAEPERYAFARAIPAARIVAAPPAGMPLSLLFQPTAAARRQNLRLRVELAGLDVGKRLGLVVGRLRLPRDAMLVVWRREYGKRPPPRGIGLRLWYVGRRIALFLWREPKRDTEFVRDLADLQHFLLAETPPHVPVDYNAGSGEVGPAAGDARL